MLGPFATASCRTPIHPVSLPVQSHAACASISTTTTTTTTTTTRDRGTAMAPWNGPNEEQEWLAYRNPDLGLCFDKFSTESFGERGDSVLRGGVEVRVRRRHTVTEQTAQRTLSQFTPPISRCTLGLLGQRIVNFDDVSTFSHGQYKEYSSLIMSSNDGMLFRPI